MFRKILSGSLLVAGTTVGAGMLGIPLLTAQAGFWPAVVVTIVAWFLLLLTGILYLEAALWMPLGSNLLSMSYRFLGKGGRILAGAMFLFLYYCLLVAYYAAGAPMLGMGLENLLGVSFSGPWSYILFGILFGGIIALGAKWIDRANLILVAGMIFSYIFLMGLGIPAIDSQKLEFANWPKAVFALPILFSAFGYHNILPSLVTHFGKDKRAIRLSIVIGTILALFIYLIWQWLVLGMITPQNIEIALREGKPVTAALQGATGKRLIFTVGQLFAFFALVTSLLGVAFSVVDFLADGLKMQRTGKKRVFLTSIAFCPPLILSILYPAIFDEALGIAGGVGEAVLNGLIPIALVWSGCFLKGLKTDLKVTRLRLGALSLAILFVMILEVVYIANSR